MHTDADVALFLFAHQDDEYAAAPWLGRELASGAAVWCAYFTDGAARTPAHERDAETRTVLNSLGIRDENIGFLGGGDRVADGALPHRLEYADELLMQWIARRRDAPTRVYTPDWEGGHPDHDAVHALGAHFSMRLGIPHWAFSIYNGYHCPPPFFSCLRLLPGGEKQRLTYSFAQGWRWAMLCWHYRSQRRTWLGLFPGAFVARVLLRRESIRRCDPRRLADRPHKGTLLYERLFAMPYQRFDELTREFTSKDMSQRPLHQAAPRPHG